MTEYSTKNNFFSKIQNTKKTLDDHISTSQKSRKEIKEKKKSMSSDY
jgi:archaellum component FlaF (FlaF/FlaG flagellin family)